MLSQGHCRRLIICIWLTELEFEMVGCLVGLSKLRWWVKSEYPKFDQATWTCSMMKWETSFLRVKSSFWWIYVECVKFYVVVCDTMAGWSIIWHLLWKSPHIVDSMLEILTFKEFGLPVKFSDSLFNWFNDPPNGHMHNPFCQPNIAQVTPLF